MTETIKVASFTASHKSEKSGKIVPATLQDGNDRRFAVDRAIADFVSTKVGQSLEIEFTEKVNGQYTNRFIVTAKDLPAPAKTGWQPKSPEERREIVREVALKAAVDLYGSLYHGKGKDSGITPKQIIQMMELFADRITRLGTDPEGPVEDIPW